MQKKRVYFVRHGEAAGNRDGFTQTATTPLTETGHRQASLVAERFRNVPVEVVYASYMDRAQDTARYIAAIKGQEVQTIEHFHEFLKPTSVQGAAHISPEYQQYLAEEFSNYTDPEWRCEDGENFADILERVAAGISFLEDAPEQHVVVTTHGRLLRFIAAYLILQKDLTAADELRMNHSFMMSNTGITLFEYDGELWRLVTWNDIAHFAE